MTFVFAPGFDLVRFMKIPMLLTVLLLTSLAAFAALVHTSSLENGLVVLQINTSQNQVVITNNDPSRTAVFNVFPATDHTNASRTDFTDWIAHPQIVDFETL